MRHGQSVHDRGCLTVVLATVIHHHFFLDEVQVTESLFLMRLPVLLGVLLTHSFLEEVLQSLWEELTSLNAKYFADGEGLVGNLSRLIEQ